MQLFYYHWFQDDSTLGAKARVNELIMPKDATSKHAESEALESHFVLIEVSHKLTRPATGVVSMPHSLVPRRIRKVPSSPQSEFQEFTTRQ